MQRNNLHYVKRGIDSLYRIFWNGIMETERHYNFRGQSGVSLVELLVVIVVILIVASIAFMQRGSANEQFQRQNAARELKTAFERARFDSVKRRADGTMASPFAYVEVRNNAFTLRTYKTDVNGLATANDQAYPFPAGVAAEGFNFTIGASKTVQFNRRGEAIVVGGGNPQYMVCNGTCPAAPGNVSATNTVLVTPTGTVNLLGGGVAIPSFLNPTGQEPVGDSEGIRDEAVL